MKNFFTALGISLVLGVSGIAYAQSAVKIGYIDLQRVIRESQAGKTAKVAFENEFQKKKEVIEQKATQLADERQEFVSKAPVMDTDARNAKAEDIDRREKELQRIREDFRDELQRRDLELTQKILNELEDVIEKLGSSEGYTLIVEKTEGGVIYGGKGADLTDKVIQAYDAKKASSKR